jgi:protein-L-isoaspartate(D-aspartate) O-methyltransferase
MDDFSVARTRMIDSQLRTEAVTDFDILAVMGRVPREAFVPVALQPLAYLDDDIQIKAAAAGGVARFLMEPAPFARLLQLAEITSADRILDVGIGTGYSAAVLAGLGKSVVGLESDSDLATEARGKFASLAVENVKVVTGPLDAGYAVEGPFDVIVVEGATEIVPASLFNQLREGGRMVAVVGYGRSGMATLFTKSDGQIGRRAAFNADVRPLPAFRKAPAFVF